MVCNSECIFVGSAELSSRCERPSSCRKTEEGVGALELLADGVALADGVVAGVEPGGREVALDAAPEFASIGLNGAIVFYIISGANSLVQ